MDRNTSSSDVLAPGWVLVIKVPTSKIIDPLLFRETLGHYPTGVAVVTAMTEDAGPAGMVVGTFSSVSLDPPLVAFFPATNSGSFAQLREARAFAVNVLACDQEDLCRQFVSGGRDKFAGVEWWTGPLGSPILAGVVSWVECSFEEVRRAGDHFIVLGRVHDLAVERVGLPLLFFQGGYGRFAPGSFVPGPDPELIQAVQEAQGIRPDLEALAAEYGVNCSVLVSLRGDAVQVLASHGGWHDEPFPLGHRQPLIPPMGAAFLVNSPEEEVEVWLGRAPEDNPHGREAYQVLLHQVRERGYTLMGLDTQLLGRQQEVLSRFERTDRLPRHERALREATSALMDIFCPDLIPGRRYDLASLVVPVEVPKGRPAMAIRMGAVPPSASTEQIEEWLGALRSIAGCLAHSMVSEHD